MPSPSQEAQTAAAVLRSLVEPASGLPGLARMACEWPATVAHEAQRLIDELHTGNVAGTTWQLCDLAEVICKFSSLVMVCDLQAHSAEEGQPLLARLFHNRPLSFGAWFTMTIDAATTIARLPASEALLVPELASVFVTPKGAGGKLRRTALANWVERTVQFRNHTRGHGAYGTDLTGDAAALAANVQRLDALLADLQVSWPSDVLLQVAPNGERAAEPLMGAPVLTTRRGVVSAHVHGEQTLPLELARGQRVLAVSPLIALRRCTTCGKQDCFLFDSLYRRNGPPTFFMLDYLTGHRLSLSHLADPTLHALADSAATLREGSDTAVGDEFSETALQTLLLATDVEARRIKPRYLLDVVTAFCDERERGILLIEGPGYIGKSVAMAALESELAENRPDILMLRFAVKKELQYTARQLDLSLADRLRQGFGRQEKDTETTLSLDTYMSHHPGEPPDKVFVDFLQQVMHGPLRPACIRQLLIVIDGLDELRPAQHEVPIEALLPAPDTLPDDCFLVLTSRPLAGKDVPASVRSRLERLALAKAPQAVAQVLSVAAQGGNPQDRAYQQLLRTYFDGRMEVRRSAMSDLSAPGTSKPRAIDRDQADRLFFVLYEKSQGLFGYLAHLTNLVEDGLLDAEHAERLPQGESIYGNFLDVMEQRLAGGASGKPWQAVKQLLLVLVADERAFERESAEWDQWLPPREYRGLSLDVLCRLVDQPGITYGLVWTLYAFKHLLASWRGSEGGLTHWRLGLRDLRHTIEQRWPEALQAEHRRMVESVIREGQARWDELQTSDPYEQQRYLGVVWHAVWLADAQPRFLAALRGLNETLARWGDLDLGLPELAVRTCLVRLCLLTLSTVKVRAGNVGDTGQLEVGNALQALGIALHSLGWSGPGVKALDQAIALMLTLCERGEMDGEASPPQWRNALAGAFMNRGVAKQSAPGHGPSAAIEDYNQAIAILQALVLALGEACPPHWRNDLASAFMNRGVARRSAPGHGPSAAIEDYDQAIAILQALVLALGEACPPQWRNDLASVFMNRGNAKQAAPGHGPSAAIEDYDQAIAIRQPLVLALGEACPSQWRNDLASAFINRGNAKQSAPGHGPSAAIEDYDQAIAIRQPLVLALGEACPPQWRNDLASAFINRGNAKQSAPGHGPSAAIEDYEQAIAILQALVLALGEACPPQWRNDLASAIVNRSNAKQAAPGHGPSAAIEDYDQAIAILQALVLALGEACPPQWRNDLASTFMNRGVARQSAPGHGPSAAIEDYDQAIAILQALVLALGEACPPQWRNDLASAFMNCGVARQSAPGHGPSAAIEDYDQAIAIRQPLVLALGEACPPQWRNDLASVFMNRGVAKQSAPGHGPSAAIEDYNQAIAILQALVLALGEACPPQWRNDLAGAFVNRGVARRSAPGHGPSAAIEDYDQAISIRQPLVLALGEACPPQWRNDLASAFINRGNAKQDAPDHGPSAAIEDYDQAIAIRQPLVLALGEACPPQWRNDLASAFINRGNAKQDAPDHGPSAAIEDYDQAIAIRQALALALGEACPPQWRNDLASAFMNRGNAKQDAPGHGPSAAIEDYDQAIAILQALVLALGEACPPQWRTRLASMLQQRSRTWASLGDLNKATADETAALLHGPEPHPNWLIPGAGQHPTAMYEALRAQGSGTVVAVAPADLVPPLAAWLKTQATEANVEVHARLLACLPNCVFLQCTATTAGQPRLANLIWGPGALIWLDGSSPALHTANQWGWVRCDSPDQAAEYVKLFCLHVRGEDGPFLPIDAVTDIPWQEDAGLVTPRDLVPKLAPMHCGRQEDGSFLTTCDVLYGTSLFRASFALDANRQIVMQDDKPLVADLPVFRLQMKDGWSWWQ